MLFDWFTVFAQIANFLILMWLLKRFLYKPVLNAIDTREKRIADLLSETASNQQEMERQQLQLSKKNAEFALQRDNLLAQAAIEAEQQKQQMLNEAASQTQQQRTKWLQALQNEQASFYKDISQRSQQGVFSVARKALLDLCDVSLEAQITKVFINQLAAMDKAQRQAFFGKPQRGFVITSAMALSESSKKEINDAIVTTFEGHQPVSFDVNPALICGIELRGNDHVISWNINEYLVDLEQSVLQPLHIKMASEQGSNQLNKLNLAGDLSIDEPVSEDAVNEDAVNEGKSKQDLGNQKASGAPNV